jgi:hypothetical protein
MYLRDYKSIYKKYTCIPMFIAIPFNAAKLTHTMENYSAIKKNEIMSFSGKWMKLEIPC